MNPSENDDTVVVRLGSVAGAVEKTSATVWRGGAPSVGILAGSWRPVFIDLAPSGGHYSVGR